ncbi:MAG: hypothetical protein ACOC7J_04240 [Armatimonadota bacterium]
MDLTMAPDERANEDVCPVCGTQLPEEPGVRRCPRCGARALAWRAEEPLAAPVVLFNARLAGIMAGVFTAMLRCWCWATASRSRGAWRSSRWRCPWGGMSYSAQSRRRFPPHGGRNTWPECSLSTPDF